MRQPKPEWVVALRALCGAESDLRFNEQVGRWEFMLPEADGNVRSQFWGWFHDEMGNPIEPDPVTGMHPFRDLDDAGMRTALRNLEETFIGNRFDGAGSNAAEVQRRWEFNQRLQRSKYKAAGDLFADMFFDRLRSPQISVPVVIGSK